MHLPQLDSFPSIAAADAKNRLRRAAVYLAAFAAPVSLTILVTVASDAWPKPYSWQYLGITVAVAASAGVGPAVVALSVGTAALLWLQIPTPVHPGVEMFAAVAIALLIIIHRYRAAERDLRNRALVLHAVIEAMPDAVYVGTGSGISLCNTNALRMLGCTTLTDLPASGESLAERLNIRWPDSGKRLRHVELPFTRALRGETAVEEVLATKPETGEDVFIRSACAPILDDGSVVGAVAINSDMTERRRSEEALRESERRYRTTLDVMQAARAAAEEANQAKDRFLAVLSHELRTPLTPVLAGIALLKRDETLSDQARKYVDVLHRNVDLEARLIDDLLDVTRITHGKFDLKKRPIELRTVLEHTVEVCQPDIDARKLHFGVDYRVTEPCFVDADGARLQQVFWNLLKNAIKFTPKGGCVGIRCSSENGHVVVEVNDSGLGIAPGDLPVVFDAFAQAERTLNRHFGGLGLGLTISRALVEKHGGTITASSEGVGKGATFCVRLPLLTRTGSGAAPSSADQRQHLRAPRPLRVLVVEDHADTAQMMAAMIEGAGHHVETATDFAAALDAAQRRDVDLLVSDLGLPGRSGIDLVRELRTRGYRMPAIAVSGYGHEQDVRRTLAAGFAAYLVKPVDVARLMASIDAAVTGTDRSD